MQMLLSNEVMKKMVNNIYAEGSYHFICKISRDKKKQVVIF